MLFQQTTGSKNERTAAFLWCILLRMFLSRVASCKVNGHHRHNISPKAFMKELDCLCKTKPRVLSFPRWHVAIGQFVSDILKKGHMNYVKTHRNDAFSWINNDLILYILIKPDVSVSILYLKKSVLYDDSQPFQQSKAETIRQCEEKKWFFPSLSQLCLVISLVTYVKKTLKSRNSVLYVR